MKTKSALSFLLVVVFAIAAARPALATHECRYHAIRYQTPFDDVINIFGCFDTASRRYFNAYTIAGLQAGWTARITMTAVTIPDVYVQVQSLGFSLLGIPAQVLAYGGGRTSVTVNFPVTASGSYDLIVTTNTALGTGQYTLYVTFFVPANLTPTVPPPPFTPIDRSRPTATPTTTPTPRTRIVRFRL